MNEWTTSAFVAPGSKLRLAWHDTRLISLLDLKFLILHEHKHDDGIRNFFYDVWEMVVKVSKAGRN